MQHHYEEQITTIKNSESFKNHSNILKTEKKNEIDRLKLMVKITIFESQFKNLE